MTPKVTLRKALTDPQLLGKSLEGDSWKGWRTLLIATMGEKLTADELEIYTRFTGRDKAPTRMVREGLFIAGRRAGKTRALAILMCYIATLCKHPALAPGEVGRALLIALDKSQAALSLGYAAAALQDSPLLAQKVRSKTVDSIVLDNNIEIMVRSPSFRAMRGLTLICALGDESAFWFTQDRSANPDTEILAALKPALLTTGGPLFLASSPYAKRGILFEGWRRDYGPDGSARILVARGTSKEFNPSLPQEEIDEALERDPEWAKAEYLAQWRDDIESFVSRDAVERCIGEKNVIERPYMLGMRYHCFVDAAGGSGADSMTMAIAHKHQEAVMIDKVVEVKPPFHTGDAVADFCKTMRDYKITAARADRYAAGWVVDAFRAQNIIIKPSEENKSALYENFLPMINTGGVILLDDMRTVIQIANLERRARFGGREPSIGHPSRGHDDRANVIAGVAVHAQRGKPMVGAYAGARDHNPPKVLLGYPNCKKAGKGIAPNRSRGNGMGVKFEMEAAGMVQSKREPVGNEGHEIGHTSTANDDREKWTYWGPGDQELGSVFGKQEAIRLVHELIEKGTISR